MLRIDVITIVALLHSSLVCGALCTLLKLNGNIERFHSRDQHLCKFMGTKESACIRKEINSHRIGLEHQHGRRFIVLEHQYGRRDVMWKRSINIIRVLKVNRCINLTIFGIEDVCLYIRMNESINQSMK